MRSPRHMAFGLAAWLSLAGCVSLKTASSPAPEDLAVEILLCKKIDDRGELYKPADITSEFSSSDKEIICFLKLKNIHKAVRLNWKWYSPDGKLFHESRELLINAEEEEVEILSAFDRITLPEEGKIDGQWVVVITMDREFIGRKSFIVKKQTNPEK